MKKKVLAAILCVAMTVSLAVGCGSNAEGDAKSGSTSSEAEGKDEGAGDALNIAIVSSPNGVDDGSFNEDNYNGVLAYIDEHPDAKVTTIREETGVPATVVEKITEIAGSYDVVVCLGFQCAGIGTVAQDNPDVDFILVDSFPTDAEGAEVELDNVYAMQFAEQESGFFAGIAAALETQTNKVAVMNGQPFPSNVNYQFGFESGVNLSLIHI